MSLFQVRRLLSLKPHSKKRMFVSFLRKELLRCPSCAWRSQMSWMVLSQQPVTVHQIPAWL